MKTIEEIFDLIKQTNKLSGKINDYEIKLSKGKFERENLIGIYKIRKGIATRQENDKLANQINQLLIGLENDSGNLLKAVTIEGKDYFGMYYLSEDWDKVIGSIEGRTDDPGI